jgi:hypothetical protein
MTARRVVALLGLSAGIPAAFFLSVASPTAKQPNGWMNLAYIGALLLAAAVLSPRSGSHSRRTAHGQSF